jgi:hypothetical protein
MSLIQSFTEGPKQTVDRLNELTSEVNRLSKAKGGICVAHNNMASGRTTSLMLNQLRRRMPKFPPTTGATKPIGHWPFNSIDGDEDISVSGLDATLAGHANTDCDVLQLDGTGDYASLDSHVDSFKDITAGSISLWFYPTATNKILFCLTHGALPLANGSFYFAYTSLKKIRLYCYGVLHVEGHPATSRSLDLHRWHHLCYVSDSTGHYFYIDGELETDLLYSFGSSGVQCFLSDATIDTAPDTMRIGHIYYNSTADGEWRGGISDVRIYNKALRHGEVLELYKAGDKRFLHADEVFGACRIFEVQHAATAGGDGIYDCYAQTLDATEWDDTAGDSKVDDFNTTEVEVLNLAEFDCEPEYAAQLRSGDLLLGFRHWDDEAGFCWVGVPFRQYGQGSLVREACCSSDAPTNSATISCYLDSTHTTNQSISVVCSIAQGGTNLGDAIPRLKEDDLIAVYKKPGSTNWGCTTVFQPSEDCACY